MNLFKVAFIHSGWQRGAAVRIEKGLKRPLLWLPCRHHIGELLVQESWFVLFGKDKAPYFLKFKEFQGNWDKIEKTSFETLTVKPWMRTRVSEIVQFCQFALTSEKLARNDYREFIELVLFVLGSPPENFTFKLPGAVSKVRWMAVVIYGIKLFLFRSQLDESADFKLKLERFVIFVCLYYVKHWSYASSAKDAPIIDLTLYKDMFDFQDHDPVISSAVQGKLRLHTWYMNQEYVVFNLFSELVDDKIKKEIVEKLELANPPKYSFGFPPNPVKLPLDKKSGKKVCVSDFVGHGSLFIFDIMKFDRDWLQLPISSWKSNASYLEMEQYLKTLLVVNDAAERGIKLVSEYVDCLTKDSANRQDLLQVVEAHQKLFPNCNKSTLSKDFSV